MSHWGRFPCDIFVVLGTHLVTFFIKKYEKVVDETAKIVYNNIVTNK